MQNFDSPDDHTSQFGSSILWPGRSKIEGIYSIVPRRISKMICLLFQNNTFYISSTQTPILEATIERNVDLLTDLLKQARTRRSASRTRRPRFTSRPSRTKGSRSSRTPANPIRSLSDVCGITEGTYYDEATVTKRQNVSRETPLCYD